VKRGDVVRVSIRRLAPDGSGYAELDGRSVLVRGALPGDEAEVRVQAVKRHTVRVKLESIVNPGVERIPPRCSHYRRCGGCTWQDVPYDVQCRLKADMVRDVLDSVPALGAAGEAVETVPSDDVWFYRNKMEFSFDSPPGSGGSVLLGLHEAGRYDRVFDLERCWLQSEMSNRAVETVRGYAVERGLSVYGLKSHRGLLRYLVVREGKNTGDFMVNLVTSGDDFPGPEEFAGHVVRNLPGTTTVIRSINRGKGGVTLGEERRILFGGGGIHERIGNRMFSISPDSFFQTNTRQTVKLYDTVKEFADLSGSEKLLDLYCGAGTIGIYLADDVKTVTGVESFEQAVEDARKNAELNGVTNAVFIAGKVESVIDESLGDFDVVVCDPPRAGIHPKALDRLLHMRIPRMVYVSCNAGAMAHDLEMLAMAGYRLAKVRVFDMSPHTRHVETVVSLKLR